MGDTGIPDRYPFLCKLSNKRHDYINYKHFTKSECREIGSPNMYIIGPTIAHSDGTKCSPHLWLADVLLSLASLFAPLS